MLRLEAEADESQGGTPGALLPERTCNSSQRDGALFGTAHLDDLISLATIKHVGRELESRGLLKRPSELPGAAHVREKIEAKSVVGSA